MRLPLIAGNWKMNTDVPGAVKLVTELKSAGGMLPGVETVVCPPFVSLAAVAEKLRGSGIKVGAQNVFYEEKGAFTGEVSPLMLTGLCEYVILGHSERRQYFHETNEIVNKKLKAAIKAGLKPILCVGENLAEYEADKTGDIVAGQLRSSLRDVTINDKLVVAYEPIWAIGTGKAATGARANDVIKFIRQTLAGLINPGIAQLIRVIYGGSVTAENIAEFMQLPEIDGGLVGGASLKADQFVSIVKQTAQIKNNR